MLTTDFTFQDMMDELSSEFIEELEVLSSILDADDLYFNENCAMITIHCSPQIPTDSITLCSIIDGDKYDQVLNHLSHVTVQCGIPAGYPISENLSSLQISCQWLTAEEKALVTSQLLEMWVPGDPVLFQIVTWVRDDLLPFLDIYDHIIFSESEQYESIPLVRITILDHFNRDITRKEFGSGDHECCVCFSRYPGMEMSLLTCLHPHCTDCLSTLIQIQMDDGKFCDIDCATCDTFLGRDIIKDNLSAEAFADWEEKFQTESVETDPQVLICPRCSGYAVKDDNLASCSTCYFKFCEECNKSWHPGRCETFQTDEAGRTGQVKKGTQLRAGRKNEELTKLFMKAYLMRCPKCKVWVMRDFGCNHMHCHLCNTDFCYFCGLRAKNHVSSIFCSSSKPVAPLDIEEPSIQDESYLASYKQPGMIRNVVDEDEQMETVRCVGCKHLLQRQEGNNHAKCAVCRAQFCFLCRAAIKGTTHFNAVGCAQHGGMVKKI